MSKFYYAVAKGYGTGIYNTWAECSNMVDGFSGAKYKKFSFYEEAVAYLKANNVPMAQPLKVEDKKLFSQHNNKSNNKQNKQENKKKTNKSNNEKSSKKNRVVEPIPQETIDCDYVVYTDGSCLKNPEGPGGFAGFIISPTAVIQVSGGEHSTTNNRMELRAVIETLKQIPKDSKVELFSDSQYFIKAIECNWLKKWKQNNWTTANGTSVKNIELWKEIDEVTSHLKINYHWVKGHIGVSYNERCDEVAKKEADIHWQKPTDDASFIRQSQIHKSRTAIDYKTFQDIVARSLNKTKAKSLNYENAEYVVQDRMNENLLDDIQLRHKFDDKVKVPKQILDISIRRKETNEKISKYRVSFYGEYNSNIKAEFMKNFLENKDYRKQYLIIGEHWDGIINQVDKETGLHQICLKNIKYINKKDNPSYSDFVHLKVGGKDKYSSLSGKLLIDAVNPSDLEIIKKENFDEKDFESALRWSLRGLKAEFCVKKTKIDIAKKEKN